jgi:glucan phosphoethanolaminetransferase (alkaline phosphatase superfamily)
MLAYIFVILAAAFRFAPALHLSPFHLTPVGASLLFFGASRKRREVWFPVLLFTVGDVLLNRFVYDQAFHADQFINTAWYAVAVLIGYYLARTVTAPRVVGASLSASISFYVVSNFGVWLGYDMYAKTWQGLLACYAAAVPFFRNTLVSDLLFSAVLFSIPVAIAALRRQDKTATI